MDLEEKREDFDPCDEGDEWLWLKVTFIIVYTMTLLATLFGKPADCVDKEGYLCRPSMGEQCQCE